MNEKLRVGKYGYAIRNDRGSTFINYLEERGLFTINSFFKTKKNRGDKAGNRKQGDKEGNPTSFCPHTNL